MSERDKIKVLRHALEFYADPTRYQGPNQKLGDRVDPYTPEGNQYRQDVGRDGGQLARRALQA